MHTLDLQGRSQWHVTRQEFRAIEGACLFIGVHLAVAQFIQVLLLVQHDHVFTPYALYQVVVLPIGRLELLQYAVLLVAADMDELCEVLKIQIFHHDLGGVVVGVETGRLGFVLIDELGYDVLPALVLGETLEDAF